jgi:hypothetical protein
MSIHQEALIDATPLEVYAYLTDGETFAAATGKAARLEACAGSAFSLFDGRVEGRQIELAPGDGWCRRGGSAVRIRMLGTSACTRWSVSP